MDGFHAVAGHLGWIDRESAFAKLRIQTVDVAALDVERHVGVTSPARFIANGWALVRIVCSVQEEIRTLKTHPDKVRESAFGGVYLGRSKDEFES